MKKNKENDLDVIVKKVDFDIDKNKTLYIIICGKCGHSNQYNKIITSQMCFCEKCNGRIN